MSSDDVTHNLIDSPPEDDPNRVMKDLLAGTVGGVAQVLTGMPFDTTKVRLVEGDYKGPIDVVTQLLKNEGILGFYKGTLTPLIGIGGCVAMQFGVNEYMKRLYGDYYVSKGLSASTPLTGGQFYICGAASGLANAFLASPIELIRIKLQIQTGASTLASFKGPIDCFSKVFAHSGVRGIYKGLGPTLVREAHGMGLYFLTFEALVKNEMSSKSISRKDIPGWKLCLFGASAGVTMWLTSYPIDIVKTKLQTDKLQNPKYKSSLDAIKDIYKVNGVKGYFRGFLPTILRAAPANAATFYAFELTMRLLG